MHSIVFLFIAWLATITVVSQAHAQTRRDIVRGTVTTDSGRAIEGADVVITMAPARVSQAAKTDGNGRYSMIFAEGTGDYLVHVSSVGYETFRKRVTRAATDSVFIVDAKLGRSGVQQLATVNVQAQKPKPDREDYMWRTEVGASEKLVGGVSGAVSPDQAGDLAAIGTTIPGVAATSGGLSVGGVGAGQNSTTLNGMAFAGADVPRDARTTIRVSSSTYDPARGWFGGINENVEIERGGLFATRSAHLTVDAPVFQYTDPISARLGERFSSVIASFGGEGDVADDKYVYNYGLQAGRRVADAVSLSDAAPDLLQHAGVSGDSAARLFELLSAQGIPLRASGVPAAHVKQNASFIARFDHAPYNWSNFEAARTTWGLLAYGKLGSDNAVGTTPISTAGHGGSTSQAIGMLQGLYSTYFRGDYLNEERSAFTFSHNRSEPYLKLPDGRVLVASSFPDRTGGLTSLTFGGSSSLLNNTRQWTWETTSETQFYAKGGATHRVKLNADSRLDGIRQDGNANSLGTFAFNSLGDLGSNQPTSFTRTLAAPILRGSVWNGYIAAGDLWRKSASFQILYGARLEGNRYTSGPALNSTLESTYGLRTDNVPNTVHISPRIGFTWIRKPESDGIRFSRLGQFFTGPASYVRGGVGEFRSILPANLLTNASIATGLPNGLQSLTCVGPAAPAPDWTQYASDPTSIPTQCINGVTPAFTDIAPSVQLFDPAYTAPRSWRGNLAYSSSYKLLTYSIEGLYSVNLNQPGRADVNFNNIPRFVTPDEGRPVFISPTSIVAATGALSTVEARVSPLFGHVIDNVSTLTSRSKQATISLSPDLDGITNWFLSLNYTLADTRARESGFDGATFGSPVARSWARSDLDVRHQILLQGGYTISKVAITFFGRLQSGFPFTPMVGGDVNGDGLANDRAFIFNPVTMRDTSLGSATRTLLSSSSPSVRNCLTRQMDRAASRNSCEGPWSASLNAQLSFSAKMPITHQWGTIALALSNPLGGLDQLLHGMDHLRGWGTTAYPDPVLYSPRGFNATTDRFTYAINPRFGNTRPTSTLLRAPFRVTLDIALTVGRPLPQQQLNRWIKPGRGGRKGPRLSAKELERRYARNVPDPYTQILEQSDSLLLTRDQSEAIQKADTVYHQREDSVWASLSEYLAALGDNYDSVEALKRQEAAVNAGWEVSKTEIQRTLPSILSPIQLRLLPWMPAYLLKTKGDVGIRMFLSN